MSSGAVIRADETKRARPHGPVPARANTWVPCASHSSTVARVGQTDAARLCFPRQRIHIGELIVELHNIAPDVSSEVTVARSHVLLLVPVASATELSLDGETTTCPPGTAFLHATEAKLTVAWRAGAPALLIFLRRDRVNAAISAILADGRRLGSIAAPLPHDGGTRRLEHAAERILRLAAHGGLPQTAAGAALESALYDALAERISGRSDLAGIAPPVRAVSEAMRVVREDHCRPYDVEGLAARVGVTGQTLRKGFRSCLDMTVKEYIRSVRLAWVYERLDGARESRSLHDLAMAAGFTSTPAFSRAYLSRYGETPSRTRARAVQRQR
jgi:AraC-like DNA-binding protein